MQHCTCGRDIPPTALWKVMALDKQLRCGGCGWTAGRADLIALIEDENAEAKVRAQIAAFVQLERYGSTSADAILNAIPNLEPKVVGGVLGGLTRAGLVARAGRSTDQLSVAALIVERPAFTPGPLFPRAAS